MRHDRATTGPVSGLTVSMKTTTASESAAVAGHASALPREVALPLYGSAGPPSAAIDLLVGVILPPFLLMLDPIVFRGTELGLGGSVLGSFKAGCYTATALFVVALAWWLWT